MDGVTVVLDASTYEGSVAVLRDGLLAAERTVAMRGEHEERLMLAVADALTSMHSSPTDIRCVVCGAGPGSFTSLRIAGAIAKGLAFATGAPLYAVPSLALAAVEAGAGRWIVTLDAMRGDVFAAGFEWSGSDLNEIVGLALRPLGEARAAAETVNAELIVGRPHARAAGALIADILKSGPVDLATWEPGYGRLPEAQVRWEATHGRSLAP